MSEKINDVAIEKKGKKKKVVTIIVSCLLAALVIGGLAFHFWLKSTGKIIVPEFTQIAEDTYAYSEGMNQTNIYLLVGESRSDRYRKRFVGIRRSCEQNYGQACFHNQHAWPL